jgi:leader peptidase (prepilin peptidase)/N-methyltransferase
VIGTGKGRQAALGVVLFATVICSLFVAGSPDGLFGAFLALLMLAIAAVDAERYLIPNELTGAAFALALLRAGSLGADAAWREMLWALARAAAVAGPMLLLMIAYRRWRGRDGLGLGDVKLAAVAGAWLSPVTIFAVIELAALAAIGAYLLAALRGRRPLRGTAFLPFGAFLAPAIWIGWLVETWLGVLG